jgi:hypothetical protein
LKYVENGDLTILAPKAPAKTDIPEANPVYTSVKATAKRQI